MYCNQFGNQHQEHESLGTIETTQLKLKVENSLRYVELHLTNMWPSLLIHFALISFAIGWREMTWMPGDVISFIGFYWKFAYFELKGEKWPLELELLSVQNDASYKNGWRPCSTYDDLPRGSVPRLVCLLPRQLTIVYWRNAKLRSFTFERFDSSYSGGQTQ